jgi:GntR family transcriptional regulator / MocR family aminotransferase
MSMQLNTGPGMEGLGLRAQIYKAFLDAIIDGRFSPGARLPSARQLALEWHVSRNTVDEGIGQLQSEGFVLRRVGSGSYIAHDIPGSGLRPAQAKVRPPAVLGRRVLANISAWGRTASSAYAPNAAPRPQAFLAGLPALDHFPLDLWRHLVARRLRSSGRDLLGYFPSMGYPPLREATARHLATTRGIICSPDQVMIVNSTMQAIDLIARVLLEPGDKAWVEDPCVPNLRSVLTVSGAQIVPVAVDNEGLQVQQGIRVAPDAALMYTTPSCQYPTGVTLRADRRLELLAWADRTGAWVVEDDYQSEFIYEGRPTTSLHSLNRGQRVLYVSTFTNSVFPSLRLAYMIIPKSLVPVFQAVRSQLDDHTHGLMQAVMADFVNGGHFSAHLRRMRAIYQSRRDALVAACARDLSKLAVLGSTANGMNAALYLPPRIPDSALAASLQGAAVRGLPLSRYAVGPRRRNGLLLGYTALSERRIAASVARLAEAITAFDLRR